jgi:hypothetical protein
MRGYICFKLVLLFVYTCIFLMKSITYFKNICVIICILFDLKVNNDVSEYIYVRHSLSIGVDNIELWGT